MHEDIQRKGAPEILKGGHTLPQHKATHPGGVIDKCTRRAIKRGLGDIYPTTLRINRGGRRRVGSRNGGTTTSKRGRAKKMWWKRAAGDAEEDKRVRLDIVEPCNAITKTGKP